MELVASLRLCVWVCGCVRGSALPSAAKSNSSHYQSSGVCLCVCNQWAYAGNCADTDDRLLILILDLKDGKNNLQSKLVSKITFRVLNTPSWNLKCFVS